LHLEHRRWYSGDFDYAFDAGVVLSEGFGDFLFVGGAPKPLGLPGFGAFVTAGDLSPFVGDDVLIVDPVADAPANLLNPLDPVREYSGLLHAFYKGSDEPRPLPFISIKPSDVDFGEVLIGSGAGKNIYIKNEGETTLHIDSISYSGDDAFVVQAPTAPLDIEPFEDRLMILEFYPVFYTTYTGTIIIHSNAPNEAVAYVNIQGVGIPESINPGHEYTGTFYPGEEVIHWFDPGPSGGVVSLDVDEMDGEVVVNEIPPITATLLNSDGDILAECLGGFLNVLFSDPETGTVRLRSEVAGPIDYQLTLNIGEPEPLTISPQNVIISNCQSEQPFRVTGGIWPYNFELMGTVLPTSLELADIDACNGRAVLKNNDCVPDALNVTVRVVDGSGEAAEATVVFVEALSLHFTAPYYAYAETIAERGYVQSSGVAYPGARAEYAGGARDGESLTSTANGYRWWCYNEEGTCCDCNLPADFNFPGDHTIFEPPCAPCTSPYIGWKASWAGVTVDPQAGRINTLVGAANDGGPTEPYCLQAFCWEPPDEWGFAQGFGYCRQVFSVQSDGALQLGDPVEIQVNFTMQGSGVFGRALLTDAQRVDWLTEWQKYLQWDAALEVAHPDYASSSFLTLDLQPVMPAIEAQVAVGDVLVLETLCRSEVVLANPFGAGSDEQWVAGEPSPLKTDPLNADEDNVQQLIGDYGNQLTFEVTVQTPGAEIEAYPPGQ
jgi:hypothetical protein